MLNVSNAECHNLFHYAECRNTINLEPSASLDAYGSKLILLLNYVENKC
jgi:hypothetical protein